MDSDFDDYLCSLTNPSIESKFGCPINLVTNNFIQTSSVINEMIHRRKTKKLYPCDMAFSIGIVTILKICYNMRMKSKNTRLELCSM